MHLNTAQQSTKRGARPVFRAETRVGFGSAVLSAKKRGARQSEPCASGIRVDPMMLLRLMSLHFEAELVEKRFGVAAGLLTP